MSTHASVGPPELDDQTHALALELFQLVRAGDVARLSHLLGLGLVPNLRDSKGDSLLMLAAYHGHAEAVRVLLRHGADPTLANDRAQTPLGAAAFKGDVDVLWALLEGGAPVDDHPEGGRTALMLAAMFDRVGMIDLLLAHGADPEHSGADGATALDLARAMGAEHAVERLSQPSKKSIPDAPKPRTG